MNHFDISRWTDFAQGVVPAADRAAMETHVSSGCGRCRAALDLVQRIVVITRTADRYEPPEAAVRWAKAIGVLQRPQGTPVSRLVARLVYNSLRDPVPAGMRAEDRLSRHALYEAGNFCLDLRFEHEKGSPLVALVGQVTNRKNPDRLMAGAPVLLMARKDIVAHAMCNRFGEFQMEYAPARHLRLCVALDPAGKRLDLPLNRLVAEMPKPAGRKTPALARLRQTPTGLDRK